MTHGEGVSMRLMTAPASARLAALSSGLSTRLGTALRHAGEVIGHARSFRKLVIVLTDGEPSDIDVADPLDLVEDARRAAVGLAGARHRRVRRGAGIGRRGLRRRVFSGAAIPCWCRGWRICRRGCPNSISGWRGGRATRRVEAAVMRGERETELICGAGQIEAERGAGHDVKCSFDAAHQRAAIGRQQGAWRDPAPFGAARAAGTDIRNRRPPALAATRHPAGDRGRNHQQAEPARSVPPRHRSERRVRRPRYCRGRRDQQPFRHASRDP